MIEVVDVLLEATKFLILGHTGWDSSLDWIELNGEIGLMR